MTSRTLIDHGTFYEGPRWHDGRWWVSDFYRNLVLSFDADGGDVREELTVEQLPSGLGWTPDGDLLVVSQMDHSLLRRSADGTVTTVATFGEHCGGFANDMVVDAQGRAYIGNAGFDLMAGGEPSTANLVRVDLDGTVAVAAEDLAFPNGSVITPTARCSSSARRWATATRRSTSRTTAPSPTGASGPTCPASRPTAAASTPRAASGAPTPSASAACSWRRAVASSRRSRRPTTSASTPACSAAPTARTLLQCCAPGFLAHERKVADDARLVATEVEVGRAGLP